MPLSNPLIAVGISTAIVIGSVGAAAAQPASPANPRSTSSTKTERPEDIEPIATNQDTPILDRLDPISTQTQTQSGNSNQSAQASSHSRHPQQIVQRGSTLAQSSGSPSATQNKPGKPAQQHNSTQQNQPSPTGQGAAAPGGQGNVQSPDQTAPFNTQGTTNNPIVAPAAPEALDQQQLEQFLQQQQLDLQVIPPSQQTGTQPGTTPPLPPPSPPLVLPSAIQGGQRTTPATPSPAPDYLNPSPNPLNFPTQPEEVQVTGTQPITLQQAIDLAIRNNPTIQQARITLSRDQQVLRQQEAANYPTLSASANITQSGSETTQQGSPFAIGPNNTLIPNPSANTVRRVYSDSTSLGGTLSLSYNIFTAGQRPAQIRAAEGQVRYQQLQVERQIEDTILTVKTNYYDLQGAGENVRIAQAAVAASEQSLRDSIALERAGVGTYFDVLQAQVQLANDRQTLISNLSNLEIARRTLAQNLNLADGIDLSTSDPVQVSGTWGLSLADTLVQAFKNRAELEQQLTNRDIAQSNRRAALAQLGPTVSLSSSFTLNNNLDQDVGFLYDYSAALSVNYTLFDGGAARAQARQYESDIATAESQFEDLRSQIRFNVEQAYSQLRANAANIQTTSLAVYQAQEALRLARLRFQAGVGTQTDVLNQQQALTQAEVNNVTAILDYNRALATLERQVSNLPEGYLNTVP